MTYIRQEWGNAAPEVTEEMIDGYLASYASRTAPWQAPAVKEDLGPDPAGGEGAAPAPEPAPAEEGAEAAPEATAAAAKPSE